MTVTEPLVKERPILFSAPMIVALLDGRKTQTRRIVKLPRGFDINHYPRDGCGLDGVGINADFMLDLQIQTAVDDCEVHLFPCPYGVVGDRLWVREAWRAHWDDSVISVNYRADDTVKDFYTSDLPESSFRPSFLEWKWKPSIHMPRCASRITLEITDVRVQRLQDISEEDAIAEGCSVRLLRDLLDEAIGKFDPPNPYWDDRDGSRIYCRECGQKECADNLDGGWSGEEDSPPHCEKCGKLLDFVCTDYCMQEEVSHCDEYGIGDSPEDAYVAMRMIHGGGHPLLTESCGEFHFHPEWTGKIAKICFRYLWNKINGEGSWESNPWVFAISFRRCDRAS